MEQVRRDVLDFWPLALAVLLIPVQTDVLIAFSGTWRGWLALNLPTAILMVVALSVGKALWSYWFWGWLRVLIGDTARFQRLALLVKQAAGMVKGEGFVDRALAELKLRHDQAHGAGKKLLAMTKVAACLFLLGAGAYPMWGTRGPLMTGVGLIRFREGFIALAVGGVVRVVYLMGSAALLASWFRQFP